MEYESSIGGKHAAVNDLTTIGHRATCAVVYQDTVKSKCMPW